MKHFYFLLTFFISCVGYAQSEPSTIIADTDARLAAMQKQIDSLKALPDKTNKEIFDIHKRTIKTGMEFGQEIESLLPQILNLIALKELSETIGQINNPTSDVLGQSFADIVIESASMHLLPKITDQAKKDNVKNKFGRILQAIYKSPITQTLLGSNPITSTINVAIQQAGFFESEETLAIKKNLLTNDDRTTLKAKLRNTTGPSFDNTELTNFFNDIKARVSIYENLNNFSINQNKITEQLYIDAKIITNSSKASKTEICKLIDIPTVGASNAIDDKFKNATNSEIRDYLKNEKILKAVDISNNAINQFPKIREFYSSVINAIHEYIDGNIRILEESKQHAIEARIDISKIDEQIEKLRAIKSTIKI